MNDNSCFIRYPCFCGKDGKYYFISRGLFILPTSSTDFWISMQNVESISFSGSEDEITMPGRPPAMSLSQRRSDAEIFYLETEREFGFKIKEELLGNAGCFEQLQTIEIHKPHYFTDVVCDFSDSDNSQPDIFIWWPKTIHSCVYPNVVKLADGALTNITREGKECEGLHLPCLSMSDLSEMYDLSLGALKQKDMVYLVWKFAAISWALPALMKWSSGGLERNF